MLWQRLPVFRIFLCYGAGILLANFFKTSFLLFVSATMVLICSSLILGFAKVVFSSYKRRWWFGVSLAGLFVALGVVISHLHTERHFTGHLETPPPDKVKAIVQLCEDPGEKKNSFGMEVRLVSLYDSAGWKEQDAKMMLYLQKSHKAKNLRYGDRILIRSRLNTLNPPRNPFEFDYQNYLNLKAIYYQAYATDENWSLVSSGHGCILIAAAKKVRRYLLNVVDRWGLNDEEKAVTKALLLGYRYDIDDDLLQAYSSAGATHVLAVSGLHIGIVYLLAGWLLGFFNRIKRGAALKSAFLILLLWSYAMITGLSASVVRAATMFTFVAVGSGFGRKTSIYNTILGSALFLLFIKPVYLFEVGFQLSYAAVFGIVWMQPHLYRIWALKNKFADFFWQITTVSIAAQLATFPLGLYYFHQFPTLFLLSNLLVIPIVTALMYIGIPALLMSVIAGVPTWLITIFGWLLHIMNASVSRMEQQAVFLLEGIHISRGELVILYILILTAFSWMVRGSFGKLCIVLSMIALLGASQWLEEYRIQSRRQVVFYAVGKNFAAGFYSGNQGIFICDSTLLRNDDALTFHIKHHWWARDVDEIVFLKLDENYRGRLLKKEESLIAFNRQLFWIYDEYQDPPAGADYWIVKDSWAPSDKVKPGDRPSKVVLCQHNYLKSESWKRWCTSEDVPCTDTRTKALVLE